MTDGGQRGSSSHILLPERVAGKMKLGGWSDVSWACRMALATETLPSCILSLPKSFPRCILATVSLARPLTQFAIPSLSGSGLCVFTVNTAVRLKTRRAPRFQSGNFAPPSRHVDSLIFGLRLLLRGPSLFAGYSKRLLGEAKTRRSPFAALAKEESQAKLSPRPTNLCVAVRRSRRIHTHLRWLAVLHRRLH